MMTYYIILHYLDYDISLLNFNLNFSLMYIQTYSTLAAVKQARYIRKGKFEVISNLPREMSIVDTQCVSPYKASWHIVTTPLHKAIKTLLVDIHSQCNLSDEDFFSGHGPT